MLTQRFDSAMSFASRLHRPQMRKGTSIPYLGHLLAVAALVIEDGGSEDEAIAALLHDSVEDRGQNYPGGREALRIYIGEQFGPSVLAIVDACTDDEGYAKDVVQSPDEEREHWLERKQKYAEGIAHKTAQALRVTTADKIHNVESILDAHAAIGPDVWNRFRTKSREDQIEVYRELTSAIQKRNREYPAAENIGLTERLFRAVSLMEALA